MLYITIILDETAQQKKNVYAYLSLELAPRIIKHSININ